MKLQNTEKQQILTIGMLESVNIQHFFTKINVNMNLLSEYLHIIII